MASDGSGRDDEEPCLGLTSAFGGVWRMAAVGGRRAAGLQLVGVACWRHVCASTINVKKACEYMLMRLGCLLAS